MAQKVQITLLCDLDDGNAEAEETLHFSLADTTYEVDVCGKHAQQIRDGLQPFVAHIRAASADFFFPRSGYLIIVSPRISPIHRAFHDRP